MSKPIHFQKRLAVQQARNSVMIAFILGICISIAQIYIDFFNAKEEFDQTINQVLQIIEQPVAQAAFNLNRTVAEDILVGLSKYRPIFEAYVYNESGEELASIQRGPIVTELRWLTNYLFGEKREIVLSLFVKPPTEVFADAGRLVDSGTLKVVIDTYQSGISFLNRSGIIILSGLFRNMILVLILLVFFHFYLTKPFLKLEQDLEGIAPQNPSKHRIAIPKGHENDEFGVLVHKTNTLLQTIEENLEHRIDKAKEAERYKIEIAEQKKREQEQKEYQKRLEASNQELQETLKTLQETQQQLIQSEKMAALGELVAGVAHEINTPVGVALTAASHLGEKTDEFIREQDSGEALPPPQIFKNYLTLTARIAKMISSNMTHAADLVNSFKQIAVDQSIEEKRKFFVREYLHEILSNLSYSFKKTKHSITITPGPTIELNSFPGGFSQVITNLLMNSLKHAFDKGEEGKIELDLKADNDRFHLTYSDNGKGIQKEHIDKIFDPFFTTKRSSGGTGLGLHLVYNIVHQTLGGTIRCESEVGKGTKFYIQLPLAV